MSNALDLLIDALELDPATSEVAVLTKIIEHIGQALTVTNYQVGSVSYPMSKVTTGNPAHVTLTNLLSPYLNAHGDVMDNGPVVYRLESQRHLITGGNMASVNGTAIPGGLVLHLANVAPDLSTNLGAMVTIAYIFNSTPTTPAIWLLAQVQIGLLKNATSAVTPL